MSTDSVADDQTALDPERAGDEDDELAVAASEIERLRTDLRRLTEVAEALLEVGPPLIVVDRDGVVRGVSRPAEDLTGGGRRLVGGPMPDLPEGWAVERDLDAGADHRVVVLSRPGR